jgi:hypothetical protein
MEQREHSTPWNPVNFWQNIMHGEGLTNTEGHGEGQFKAQMGPIQKKIRKTFFFCLAQEPNAVHSRLIPEVSTSHTVTHYNR